MKLFVETQKAQSATVPVRYCITPAERQWLLKESIDPAKALVLMSVVNDGKEVDRLVVPLDQMMAYIPFRQPGKNAIKAVIVCVYRSNQDEKRRIADLRATLMERRRSESGFKVRVLTRDAQAFETPDYFNREFQQDVNFYAGSTAEAEVNVDQRFFAKKPFDWPWVNFWFETKPADQCQLRRRRFLAYTIQPIFAAAWYFIIAPVVKIIVTLALLLWGIRPAHIGWKALWFLEQINDVTYNVKWTSDWTHYKRDTRDTEWYERNQPWWLFFFKPLWLVLAIMAVILAIGLPLTFMVIALSVLVGLAGMAIIAIVAALVVAGLKALWTKIVMGDRDAAEWEARRRQLKLDAQQAAKRRLAELRQKRLSPLACDSGLSFAPSLAALPPEKRTFHLRLWDLKAKVCRPFAA